MRKFIGFLTLALCIIISIVLIMPTDTRMTGKEMLFAGFVVILAPIILSLAWYAEGLEKGRKRYKGRAFESLEVDKRYKVNGIIKHLGSSEERFLLALQIGDNKDDIISHTQAECWLPKGLKEGAIITQNEKGDVRILYTVLK